MSNATETAALLLNNDPNFAIILEDSMAHPRVCRSRHVDRLIKAGLMKATGEGFGPTFEGLAALGQHRERCLWKAQRVANAAAWDAVLGVAV